MYAMHYACKRRGKGVSPLISSVLLIAIAVIISGLVFSWGSQVTRTQQGTVTNRSSQLNECAVIVVADAYLDFTANRSTVYVRANGETSLTAAHLLNKAGRNATLNTTLPLKILRGQYGVVQFIITNTIPACANYSQILVSTDCSSDVFSKTPEGCP